MRRILVIDVLRIDAYPSHNGSIITAEAGIPVNRQGILKLHEGKYIPVVPPVVSCYSSRRYLCLVTHIYCRLDVSCTILMCAYYIFVTCGKTPGYPDRKTFKSKAERISINRCIGGIGNLVS